MPIFGTRSGDLQKGKKIRPFKNAHFRYPLFLGSKKKKKKKALGSRFWEISADIFPGDEAQRKKMKTKQKTARKSSFLKTFPKYVFLIGFSFLIKSLKTPGKRPLL